MVTYNKIEEILKSKNMKWVDLRRKAEFSSATLTKIKNNELIALSVIIKICEVLECDIGDIVQIKKDTEMER
jgi:DNA-binding Xre family transcriptional regulator